jgi:hypothetical protein
MADIDLQCVLDHGEYYLTKGNKFTPLINIVKYIERHSNILKPLPMDVEIQLHANV